VPNRLLVCWFGFFSDKRQWLLRAENQCQNPSLVRLCPSLERLEPLPSFSQSASNCSGRLHKAVLRLPARRCQQTCSTKPLGIGHFLECHALLSHLDKLLFQEPDLGNFLISLFVIDFGLSKPHQLQADMRCHFIECCVFSNKQAFVLNTTIFIE